MKPGPSRYEEGTKNYIGIYGLREALRIFRDLGMSEVAGRVAMLIRLLRQRLEAAGFEIVTPKDPARCAGIITCHKPGADMAALFERLRRHGCVCSLRENQLRLAPHFYNTEEEVERFLAVLAD